MPFSTKPVLTVDIVEFSKRLGQDQMIATHVLIQLLHKAIPEQQDHPSKRIWSPAGDGGALTFWEDIYAALDTAIALGKYIEEYNEGKLKLCDVHGRELPRGKVPLQVRMGLHSGPVSKEIDFDERENVWGPGVNMSARVASLAKPTQIVASFDYCQQAELLEDPDVVPIGKWWAKHNMSIELFNIYKDDVGIPNEEVGEWFEPLQYPLQLAIGTYSAMADEESKPGGKAFRVLVLCKRLLDLNPEHEEAKEKIQSVSLLSGFTRVGEKRLFDDFFSRLSPSALLYFFRNAEFRSFGKDATIFQQGSLADSMMMVVSGEIEPYLEGKRIPGVVLKEGEIIGEMGLFNPKGEKRTASLQTSRSTITLTLNYDYLKPITGTDVPEMEEIRKQIWRYYCKRTRHNQVFTHPRFRHLSVRQRAKLRDASTFLPLHFNEPIHLEANDVWEAWTLVAEGSMSIYTKDGRHTEFGKGSCIGPIRLAVTVSPYSEIKISPNTHLVRVPWDIIKNFLDKNRSFRQDCMDVGYTARERLGLQW